MDDSQWVVVVRPSATQEVLVIGPFRSKARADAVCTRVERLERKVEPWWGWSPTVERLQTAASVIEELKEQA